MSDEENHARVDGGGFTVLRRGSPGAPLVVAVGPTLRPVLEATAGRDVSLAYLATVRPFPHDGVREAIADGTDVVLVEPYQAGTSAAEIAVALRDRPHRLLALGVPNAEFRHYGTGEEHRAAHGLDAAGIARSLEDLRRLARGHSSAKSQPRTLRRLEPDEHASPPMDVAHTPCRPPDRDSGSPSRAMASAAPSSSRRASPRASRPRYGGSCS